jgi:hypothetical protein
MTKAKNRTKGSLIVKSTTAAFVQGTYLGISFSFCQDANTTFATNVSKKWFSKKCNQARSLKFSALKLAAART